jgi:hypothetical protein
MLTMGVYCLSHIWAKRWWEDESKMRRWPIWNPTHTRPLATQRARIGESPMSISWARERREKRGEWYR